MLKGSRLCQDYETLYLCEVFSTILLLGFVINSNLDEYLRFWNLLDDWLLAKTE